MKDISINCQDDLDAVVGDTAIDGDYITFYEMLQKSLSQYSDKRIEIMKDTLNYALDNEPHLYKSDKTIDKLSKMEVIYLYAMLP